MKKVAKNLNFFFLEIDPNASWMVQIVSEAPRGHQKMFSTPLHQDNSFPMTPPCRPFLWKRREGHTELLSTDFFEINYCFQMVGIFFSILPNIITLHMPRSGRWRILVAHDFVGVQNPPNTDWPPKHSVIENVLDEAPRIELVRPSAPPKPKISAKGKQKSPKRKSKRRKLRDEQPVKDNPLFKFGFVYKKKWDRKFSWDRDT